MREPTPTEIEARKVLIAHQRLDIGSCICGWGVDTGDLGRCHSLHVWRELQRALTAAGWRPPPPKPDGVHWRTGTSVGRTVYNPDGDLVGLMDTPELAAAFVAAMNGESDG